MILISYHAAPRHWLRRLTMGRPLEESVGTFSGVFPQRRPGLNLACRGDDECSRSARSAGADGSQEIVRLGRLRTGQLRALFSSSIIALEEVDFSLSRPVEQSETVMLALCQESWAGARAAGAAV